VENFNGIDCIDRLKLMEEKRINSLVS
jgi:hypothetical protein